MKKNKHGLPIIPYKAPKRKQQQERIYDSRQQSYDLRLAVWKKTEGHCYYCGRLLRITGPLGDDRLTIDHYYPKLGKGGPTAKFDNLVPACYPCNNDKDDAHPDEYRDRVGPFYAD